MDKELLDNDGLQPSASGYEKTLDFGKLQDKPRLRLNISGDWAAIAANRNYLLHCPKGELCLID